MLHDFKVRILAGVAAGVLATAAYVAPACAQSGEPIEMQKNKTFISLFGLDVNAEFKYDKYFSVLPTGQATKESFTEGFYETALKQDPKPTTVALAAEDAVVGFGSCLSAVS